jgi:hypothetical protein
MSGFSIDLAAERIVDKKSSLYFEEVARSFANGCYRSSLVMLWTVVVCDLIYKLHSLRDMHGDKTAESLLKDVEAKQTANPTSPEWEIYLLDEVFKRTKLLEAGEHVQLQGLQKLRHLSAHPVLTGTDLLFHPTKEAARAHIRTAMEAVLLKPPLFSKRIVTALVEDIAANKAVLLSKSTLKSYLDARYFQNMPPPIEVELFRALWKFCFKLRNADTDAHRDINVAALGVIYDRNPKAFREAIDGDQPYFSDVGPDVELLVALIHFLTEYNSLYRSMNSAAQILINGHVDRDINLKVKSAFRHPDFLTHLRALHAENADVFDKVNEEEWKQLLDDAENEGHLQYACEIAIQNYGKSPGYDESDWRFGRFIAPMLARMDATRMTKLLELIENNPQTYDRRRAKREHWEVASAAAAISVDTSPYKNFMDNV